MDAQVTDLHDKAMLAQEYARLVLLSLNRPEEQALAKRGKMIEAKLRAALL